MARALANGRPIARPRWAAASSCSRFFHNNDLRNDPTGTDETVRRLKEAAPKAEKAGVTLGVESWLSAEDSMRMFDRVGSPAVKVYY